MSTTPPSSRDSILASRPSSCNTYDRYPHHPFHKPFLIKGVLNTARHHFASDHFFWNDKPQKGKTCDEHYSHLKHHHDTPNTFIQRTYGNSHSFKKWHSCIVDSDLNSGSDLDSSSQLDLKSKLSSNSTPKYKTKHVCFKQSCSF